MIVEDVEFKLLKHYYKNWLDNIVHQLDLEVKSKNSYFLFLELGFTILV